MRTTILGAALLLSGGFPLLAAKKLQPPAFTEGGPQTPLQELRAELAANGKLLGELYDSRTHEDIVRDGERIEPVVYSVAKWLAMGPDKVDLFGWDDRPRA
jgi:hypothetical protein